jgi:flagellar FliL protein
MTETEQREPDNGKSRSLVGRLLIVAFMGAVVIAECMFAYLWLPSAEQVAAEIELVAQQAQAGANGNEEGQANEDILKAEVDLGSFSTTKHRMLTESTFRTDFHLWGTVAEDDLDEFNELFQRNENRFRNLVIVEIHDSEIDDLVDPGLGLIKRRILEKSNALLGKPLLRSVLFADFTFVEL